MMLLFPLPGAIFDRHSEQIMTAFLFMRTKLNTNKVIELKNITTILNTTDSFAVSNASEYSVDIEYIYKPLLNARYTLCLRIF